MNSIDLSLGLQREEWQIGLGLSQIISQYRSSQPLHSQTA